MDSDQISVRVDPVGTTIAWPPELEAAVAFARQDDNEVTLGDPNDARIVLRGTFGRSALEALLAAWNPRLKCANGHVQAENSTRKNCWCGAALVR